jgi:hypothetical protein
MLTKTHLTKLTLAIGLGAALIASASSPSMARTLTSNGTAGFEQTDQAFAAAPGAGYTDVATRAQARAEQRSPEWNGPGVHYYEGDDNGSVWSYYQGYRPLH